MGGIAVAVGTGSAVGVGGASGVGLGAGTVGTAATTAGAAVGTTGGACVAVGNGAGVDATVGTITTDAGIVVDTRATLVGAAVAAVPRPTVRNANSPASTTNVHSATMAGITSHRRDRRSSVTAGGMLRRRLSLGDACGMIGERTGGNAAVSTTAGRTCVGAWRGG